MDPPHRYCGSDRRRLPRARGDGPPTQVLRQRSTKASPRTRGWTLNAKSFPHFIHGFPAHAGMDPEKWQHDPAGAGLPRARGDGPPGFIDDDRDTCAISPCFGKGSGLKLGSASQSADRSRRISPCFGKGSGLKRPKTCRRHREGTLISPCFGKGSGLKHAHSGVEQQRSSNLPLLRQGERIET